MIDDDFNIEINKNNNNIQLNGNLNENVKIILKNKNDEYYCLKVVKNDNEILEKSIINEENINLPYTKSKSARDDRVNILTKLNLKDTQDDIDKPNISEDSNIMYATHSVLTPDSNDGVCDISSSEILYLSDDNEIELSNIRSSKEVDKNMCLNTHEPSLVSQRVSVNDSEELLTKNSSNFKTSDQNTNTRTNKDNKISNKISRTIKIPKKNKINKDVRNLYKKMSFCDRCKKSLHNEFKLVSFSYKFGMKHFYCKSCDKKINKNINNDKIGEHEKIYIEKKNHLK